MSNYPPSDQPPGQPPYGGTPPGGQQPYGGGYGAEPKNSGKAIASLVTGLVGLLTICCGFFVISSVVGIVMGILARKDIRQSGGQLKGEGMAMAGLITGAVGVALLILSIILVVTGVIDTSFDYET
jgi:hypothetical protein